MEFFLTLAGLYLAQCFVNLEVGETLGVRIWFSRDVSKGRSWLTRGAGWRLVHPWPAALAWTGRSEISLDRPAEAVEALREEIKRARRNTRSLRWLSSVQLVCMLGLGPVAAILVGPETALLFLAGPTIGFHLIGMFLFYRAQSRILTTDPKNSDRLMIAALYPPAMLRGGADLVRLAFADRHVIELAAALLSDSEFERLLRSEIGRAKSPVFGGTGDPRRIDWLLGVAGQRSFQRDAILAPRPHLDPTAASYCELCGGDYLAGYPFCGECQLTTTSYAPQPPLNQ